MSDKQLRDEIMTIFLAGHETTANALSWMWKLLSEHPDVRRRLQTEIADVLQGSNPTAEDCARLPYTTAVVEETLRLYSPVPVIPRTALAEDVIGGYYIPAGAVIYISPYIIHRRPDFWQNPEGFDPSHFLPERKVGRHQFTYLPFGGGPRLCIGNNFALMEAIVITAMVSHRYELNLNAGHTIEPKQMLSLRPKQGVWVTAHKR